MLNEYFWVEIVNTACYAMNRVLLRPILNKISYELIFDKKPIIGYYKIFSCKCFILNIKEQLGKFDKKPMKAFSWFIVKIKEVLDSTIEGLLL